MIFNICGTTKIKTNFVTKIHPDLPMLIVGLLLCGLLLTFLLYNVKIYLGRMPLSHIPSPALGLTPLWFLGHLPLFSAKIEKTHSYFHAFVSIQKDIGEEVIALFFLSANIIFCTNIDMAGKILLDHRVFMKMTKKAQQAIGFGTHYVGGNRVFGPRGIAFEPGTDVWYFKRKTMDPAFHKKYLRTLLEDMNELSDSFISHLQKKIIGQPSVDIFPMFCKFTLDTVCKCSFSLDVGAMASEVSPLNDAANEIFQVIQLSYDSLSWNLPWTFKKEKALLKSRIDFVHSMLRDTLKKRLESQVQYEDTLSYIINAVSGHAGLNSHLFKMRLTETKICVACGEEDETVGHFLGKCPALYNIRLEIFHTHIIQPEEVFNHPLRKLIRFANKTKRLRFDPTKRDSVT